MKATHARLLVVLVALLIGLGALPLQAQELIAEKWGRIEMGGVRVGHIHVLQTRQGEDGATVVNTTYKAEVTINRGGVELVTKVDVTFDETEEGTPIRFTNKTQQGALPVEMSGEVKEGSMSIVAKIMGQEQTLSLPVGPEVLGIYGAEKHMKEKGLEPETAYSLKVFTPEMGKVATISVKVMGPGKVDILGEETELIRLTSTMDLMPGITQTYWVDKEGNTLLESTPMVGTVQNIYWVSKEKALGKGEAAGPPPDLFVKNFIKPNHPMHHPRAIRSATFLLKPKNPDITLPVEDATQTITERRDDGNVVLRITAVAPEGDTIPFPVEEPDLAEYLKETVYLQCKDQDIVAEATRVVGDEKDCLRAARKLEKWVFDNITKKGLDVGFASAKEVFKDRKGDCSEHGVLLAAMARAVGIPARVAIGVEYVYGIFGWHLWTEVWAGQWVPLDATLASPFVDATHIKFTHSSLNDPTMDESLFHTVSVIGNLEIDVIEYALDGDGIRPESPEAQPKVEGNAYSHPLLGISFEKPEGWSFAEGRGDTLTRIKPAEGAGEISVRVLALGYDTGLKEIVEHLEQSGELKSKEERTLGGLPALKLAKEGRWGVACQPGDTLYIFEITDSSEALDALFETFLESVKIEK